MEYYAKKKQETDLYLQKALFELMEIRPFQTITISQLCRQAEIGRKTFYRHFASLDDLLNAWFAQKGHEYIETFSPLRAWDFLQIAMAFFSFWNQFLPELKAVQSSLGYGAITRLILKNAHTVVKHRSQKSTRVFYAYSTGGLCAVLENWILEGCTCPFEKLVQILDEEQSQFVNTDCPWVF